MAELPSREQILAVLRDEPMMSSRLRGALGIPKKSKLAFKQELADMVAEGVLVRNNRKEYLLGEKDSAPEDKEFIDRPPAHKNFDERREGARSRRQRNDDDGASIKRGVLHFADNDCWTVKETGTDKEYPVAHRKNAPGKEGETIAFSLYPHPRLKHSMLAKVEKSAMPGDMTWKDVTAQFMKDANLPPDFSPSIHEFVDKQSAPTEKDLKGRQDYRKLYILCIDPEGAQDHDDAVSVEKKPDGGYRLGVHIADVSHYVPEGSELDMEALGRSYTQYLPWGAVPMLPDKLSGGLCSLHEGVDRFAFTCMMDLNDKAEVQSYVFQKSVIRVTCSISYGRAVEMFNEGDEHVHLLAEVTQKLKALRSQNGILELGSTEYGCKFDENGEPAAIVPRAVDESDSWIEECMLIANQCCAKELKLRGLQGVYRIHEAPDTRDIMELNYLMPDLFKDSPVSLRDIGKPRRGDTNLSPVIFKLYQHLISRAKGDETIINRILRSMQKAHYDSNSFGHFALNWQDYAHFTSPIRRYADLWCHRELSRTGKEVKAPRKSSVIEVCDLISANEIKNQKLERIAIKVCATWLLRDRLGEEFDATVSGVEQWGIYVSVKDPMAEGLVRFREISGNDFYIFNPDKGIVYGKRSGRTFRRGDKVRVQLLRVNPLRGEADFAILKKLSEEKPERTGDVSREEAAEAMGLVTQPTDRGYEDRHASNRDNRRANAKEKPNRFFGGDRREGARGSSRGGDNRRGGARGKSSRGGARKGRS